jgi:hypothetical protein
VSVLVRNLEALSPDELFSAQSSRAYKAQGSCRNNDVRLIFQPGRPLLQMDQLTVPSRYSHASLVGTLPDGQEY